VEPTLWRKGVFRHNRSFGWNRVGSFGGDVYSFDRQNPPLLSESRGRSNYSFKLWRSLRNSVANQKRKSYTILLINLTTFKPVALATELRSEPKTEISSKLLHMQLWAVIWPCYLLFQIPFDSNPLQKKWLSCSAKKYCAWSGNGSPKQ
jgi:hypothetical protein